MRNSTRLKKFLEVARKCKHSVTRQEFYSLCEEHRIPHSTNYLSAYTKAGIIRANKDYIYVKEVSLHNIEIAYQYIKGEHRENEKIEAALQLLSQNGYVCIKRDPNYEIVQWRKL